MNQPFKLSRSMQDSPTWRAIEAELKSQLEVQRRRNDAHLTTEQTADIRGRIAQIKACLAWAEDAPAVSNHPADN